MDFLASLADFIAWFSGPKLFLVAAFLVLVLYFAFRKKAELSSEAIRNTAATMVVSAMNVAVAILFSDEIYVFAQSAYKALGIPSLAPDFWTGTPLWAALGLIVAISVKDFADYALHRLMHTRWFWPTHAAHHSDTHVNAFTSFRVHYFESVLLMLSYMLVLTWMHLPELIPVVATLRAVHNMYVHMDLDWNHGPFKYLLASPRFHRWHHADVIEARGKNLANVMPIFDVIFGTYYVPGPCREQLGALKSGIEDKNPVLIWIYPFQQWSRMIRRRMHKLKTRISGRAANGLPRTNLPPAE